MLIRWNNSRCWDADTGGAGGAAAAAAAGGVGDAGAGGSAAGGAAAGTAAPVAFAEQLPEDIRGEAAFRDIKDLGGLAKSYLNAQKMLGHKPENLLVLPSPDADEKALGEFYAKLGRPDAPDKYGLKVPDGLPVDEKLQSTFLETAHKNGLSTKQAAALFDMWNGYAASGIAARDAATAQQLQTSTAALKQEWGAAFDDNLNLAKAAIETVGGPKLKAELEAKGLASSPELAKVFAKLGKDMQEDGVIGKGSGGGLGDVLSPGEAKQQIAALQQDPVFSKAYMTKNAPGHAEAVAKMQRLYEFAHPSAA